MNQKEGEISQNGTIVASDHFISDEPFNPLNESMSRGHGIKSNRPPVTKFKIEKAMIKDSTASFQRKYRDQLKSLIGSYMVNSSYQGDEVLCDKAGNYYIINGRNLHKPDVDNEGGVDIIQNKDGFAIIDEFKTKDNSWEGYLATSNINTKLKKQFSNPDDHKQHTNQPTTADPQNEQNDFSGLFGESLICYWTAKELTFYSDEQEKALLTLNLKATYPISNPVFGFFGYMAWVHSGTKSVVIYNYFTQKEIIVPPEQIAKIDKTEKIAFIRASTSDIHFFTSRNWVKIGWDGKVAWRKKFNPSVFEISFKLGNLCYARGKELRIYNFTDEYLVNKLIFDWDVKDLLMSIDSHQLYILCVNEKEGLSKIFVYDTKRNKVTKHIDFKSKVQQIFVCANNSNLFSRINDKIILNELRTNYIDEEIEYTFQTNENKMPLVRMLSPCNDRVYIMTDDQIMGVHTSKKANMMKHVMRYQIEERTERATFFVYEEEIVIDHGDSKITIYDKNGTKTISASNRYLTEYKRAKRNYQSKLQQMTSNKSFGELEENDNYEGVIQLHDDNVPIPIKKTRIFFVDRSACYPFNYLFYHIDDKMLIFYENVNQEPIEMMQMDVQMIEGVVNRDATILYALQKNDSVSMWDLVSKQKVRHIYDNVRKIYLSNSEKYLYLFTKTKSIEVIDIESNYQRVFSINMKKYFDGNPPDDIREFDGCNKMKVLIGDKILIVGLTHEISIFEAQFIKTFFSKSKIFSDQDFLTFYTNYRKVYKESLFLQRYFNPILLAALKGFPKALNYMLVNTPVDYPELNSHQISPMVYSFNVNDLSCAETICNYLLSLEKPVILLNDELDALLEFDYGFSKALLAKQITEVKKFEHSKDLIIRKGNIKNGINLVASANPYFTMVSCRELLKRNGKETVENLDYKELIVKAKTNQTVHVSSTPDKSPENGVGNQIEEEKPLAKQTTIQRELNGARSGTIVSALKLAKKEQSTITRKNEDKGSAVMYYKIAGQINLTEGSEGSRQFLQCYRETEHDEFIMSNWRFVIDYKWNIFLKFYLIQAFINFIQAGLLTYYLFNPSHVWAFALDIIVLGLIFFYELLTALLNIGTYFKDVDNYFDFSGVILGISVIIITFILSQTGAEADDSNDSLTLRSFQVLTMLIFYYRTMTYLKSIDYLRHIVAMLIAVTIDILDILLIFVVVIVGFALLFAKSNIDPNLTLADSLIYCFMAVFGQISDQYSKTYIDWIINIFLGIFLSLVLVNFLIAKMSNKYSELENSQIAVNYREKARIISEFEIWNNVFKKKNASAITRKSKSNLAISDNKDIAHSKTKALQLLKAFNSSKTKRSPATETDDNSTHYSYFFIGANVEKYTEQSSKDADVHNLVKQVNKQQNDLQSDLTEYKKINARTQDQIIEEIRGLKRSIEALKDPTSMKEIQNQNGTNNR